VGLRVGPWLGCLGRKVYPCKHAWVRRVGFESDAAEDGSDFVVPVAWAAAKTIECLFEEPVFVLDRVGVTNGRLDYRHLVVGENALTKCVFAVALFEGRWRSTARLTIKRMESGRSTGVYFSDFVHMQSS
jgi:hypothetical protein